MVNNKLLSKAESFIKKYNPEVPKNVADILLDAVQITRGIQKEIQELPGAVIISNLIQGTIKDGLFSSFRQEFERIRREGAIKEEYLTSKQAIYTLTELLDYLDKDLSDEQTFECLKNVFIRAAIDGKEDVRIQQYMKTIKDLPSGCLLVLIACFKLKNRPEDEEPIKNGNGHINTDDWRKKIAHETGLNNIEIVCNFEDVLVSKRLLTGTLGTDQVFVQAHNFRLSDFGNLVMEMSTEVPSSS